MKPYRDMFGNPLPKNEVEIAARCAVLYPSMTPLSLSRLIGHIGIGKAQRLIQLLTDAGVLGKAKNGLSSTVLKNEEQAVNAALRQLKKGRA